MCIRDRGYIFASIPIVITTLATGINSEETNMKEFIVNKRLMLSLADAGSRLMGSIKDISQLTGYTNRIFTLLTVLHRVHASDFNYGVIEDSTKDTSGFNSKAGNHSQEIIRGTVQRNFNGIRLENIDVIIPVSYTHLDVYKRQVQVGSISVFAVLNTTTQKE